MRKCVVAIPESVLLNKHINSYDYRVYTYLELIKGEEKNTKEIAENINIKESIVKKSINKLVKLGLINKIA